MKTQKMSDLGFLVERATTRLHEADEATGALRKVVKLKQALSDADLALSLDSACAAALRCPGQME